MHEQYLHVKRYLVCMLNNCLHVYRALQLYCNGADADFVSSGFANEHQHPCTHAQAPQHPLLLCTNACTLTPGLCQCLVHALCRSCNPKTGAGQNQEALCKHQCMHRTSVPLLSCLPHRWAPLAVTPTATWLWMCLQHPMPSRQVAYMQCC